MTQEVLSDGSRGTRCPTALVSGSSQGIGFETARILAERGIRVIVSARDADRGTAAAARLGQPFVRLDVTDPDSVRAAAQWIEQKYGVLDILVNNAGVLGAPDLLPSATPVDVARQTFETNVLGVISVTNAMLPLLRRSVAGRIVNVSSELGSMERMLDRDAPTWALHDTAYNASKAALNMLTVSYAKELWDTPVKVNAMDPGWCATAINNFQGYRTAEQGASEAVRLATLGPDGPTASFSQEQGPLPW
ncbi:SDR family oxidoreductase [Kribbella sp. NPDC051586]|uniref:SDR family oxidoreductase n=1 Tax=Kribbella sp. NPDC051586 TaxID=3364118 RepID=UPI00379736C9